MTDKPNKTTVDLKAIRLEIEEKQKTMKGLLDEGEGEKALEQASLNKMVTSIAKLQTSLSENLNLTNKVMIQNEKLEKSVNTLYSIVKALGVRVDDLDRILGEVNLEEEIIDESND